MPRSSSTFICQQCGYHSPTYLGKCPECGNWNTFVETLEKAGAPTQKEASKKAVNIKIVNLKEVEKKDYDRLSTKIPELDRVLGGGIVRGSVNLVSGDPGIGKSTLLSQLALNIDKTLYVAGEESPQQIKLRIERINPKADLAILQETDVDVICAVIAQVKPPLVIIDSIQTLETQDLESVAGSVGQVREASHRLQRVAKQNHIPLFIVGHVTKEGTVAGPKTLEHLVDVVLNLEGDPTTFFRILRTSKNRFGATDEVGIFEMEERGLKEVTNPSLIFLDEKVNAPGSAVVAILNGLRPLLLEIQALVTKSNLAIPRRIGTGIDNNRLQLLVAVLQKRLNLPLFDKDIFINVTGGLKVTEPAADLGICMAIISSLKDQNLPKESCFIGEVGLLGELRMVRGVDKRSGEAQKLGFSKVISPTQAKSLSQALKLVLNKE
jgi:DNA repair protein RadA/Sms